MARAAEPRLPAGGMMAPEAVASLERERAYQERRRLERMRAQAAARQAAMAQAAATARSAMQTRASLLVAASRGAERDRRAAEQLLENERNRRFMWNQTLQQDELLANREKAAREADKLIRDEYWEKFNKIWDDIKANRIATAMMETAQAKRGERSIWRMLSRKMDTTEKMQQARIKADEAYKNAIHNKKMYDNAVEDVRRRIKLNPYLSGEEELVGNIRNTVVEDLVELGVEKEKANLLAQGGDTLVKEIARGHFKPDDLRKFYVMLKERENWQADLVNELLKGKDKLMKPSRLMWPFESLFRPEKRTRAHWYSFWRTKPEDKRPLLKKRRASLGYLTRLLTSFENLANNETPMADDSGTVKSFVGKLIAELNAPILYDTGPIFDAAQGDPELLRKEMNEFFEEDKFDWEKMLKAAPNDLVREYIKIMRAIEEGS